VHLARNPLDNPAGICHDRPTADRRPPTADPRPPTPDEQEANMSPTRAGRAARSTRNSRTLHFFARLGFAVNGILHALIGIIAIELAFGSAGEADQSGALAALAATPGGVVVLWTVFVGLAALGIWLILNAFLTAPSERSKRVGHYASELGKGFAYLAVAATTLTFARGGATTSAATSTQASATLLSMPGGTIVVVLIGLLVIGIGIYFVAKGATQRFTRDLRLPPGRAGTATVAIGVFGYVAKGVVLGMVGILFCVAAATLDPTKSSGLDGGLKTLGSLPLGMVILVLAGLGLISYALYSFVRARYARL
jgi:hypothetical protein